MNREELQIKLNELNIPRLWYSLDGEAMPNKTILQRGGGTKGYWVIYGIDERNLKSDVQEFYSEDEACECFFRMMKKIKERTDRIDNMGFSAPLLTEEQRTFIVSDVGEIDLQEGEQ